MSNPNPNEQGTGQGEAQERCVRCDGVGEFLNGYDFHGNPYWIKCGACHGTGFQVTAPSASDAPLSNDTSSTVPSQPDSVSPASSESVVAEGDALTLAGLEKIATRSWVESYGDERLRAPVETRTVLLTVRERDRLCAELKRRMQTESVVAADEYEKVVKQRDGLAEALREVEDRMHADECAYMRSVVYDCNCHIAIARAALTAVQDE